MAITKEKKRELVAQYSEWMEQSQAVILTEYTGLDMKAMDELRGKIRDAGGEFHVVKNSLLKLACDDAEMEYEDQFFIGSTAISFAFEDPAGVAKAMTDFAKDNDPVKIKVGYLDKRMMSAAEVFALADMPPLPVMRATLLGALMAPASQLVRTLSEPGRQVAAVLKGFSESAQAPEAA